MTESLEARESGEKPAVHSERFEPPRLWRLVWEHKRASAGVLAVLTVLLATVLISDLASRVSHVSDSTACSVWSSVNQRERDAYAHLYVKERGPLPSGASDPGTIEGAIDYGCTMAYGFDEADTVTVLQALRRQY